MEFEKKGLNPKDTKRSSSQDPKEIDAVHKLYKESTKGDIVQEKSFNQYAIENHTLQKSQNNCNQRPSKIFGTKEIPLSNRDIARKQYQEATKHFIHAYQAYNETSFFLKEARESGEQDRIDYFIYLYDINLKNITKAINAMDHAKSNIKKYE